MRFQIKIRKIEFFSFLWLVYLTLFLHIMSRLAVSVRYLSITFDQTVSLTLISAYFLADSNARRLSQDALTVIALSKLDSLSSHVNYIRCSVRGLLIVLCSEIFRPSSYNAASRIIAHALLCFC